ncbi:MAG TPA: hypothetical protein DDZ81_24735 [Acetobacteraceae bacterium]|nr:hypothetical protein [Acetobacteraceae bacterium]
MPQTDHELNRFPPSATWNVSTVNPSKEHSMLQNPAWQATDDLTRAQLAMFHCLSERIALTPDDRRRALNLDERTWAAWQDFQEDGPLPGEPPLPDMLRRLSETAFNLASIADHRAS